MADKKAIYKITNLVNGKVYIGQSIHPDKRWWEHCNRAKNCTDNYPIHLAITKYGAESFSMEIIEWTEDYDNREKELIAKYNSICPNGYNVSLGGPNPIMYGDSHPNSKVKDADIRNIIADLQENKMSDRDIAKKYGITDKIVADINHGYTHRIEGLFYPIRIRKGRTGGIPMEIKLQIIKELKETTLSYSKLADKYQVTKGMIGHINHGRYEKIDGITYPIRGV